MDTPKPDILLIDVETVKKALDEKDNLIILDVRTQAEYERGRIPSSINIPLDEIDSKVDTLTSDKNESLYVYCLSGSRSMLAAEQLMKLGYKNIFNITNGLLAWKSHHYPIEN